MSNIIIETALNLWQNGRKIKKSGAGWLSGNAICCQHNGQNLDTRGRGGMIVAHDGVTYSCFNCNFKCSYKVGQTLSMRFKHFLEWLGVDRSAIDKLAIESMRIAIEMTGTSHLQQKQRQKTPVFTESTLPDESVPVDPANPDHKIHCDYIASRGLSVDDYKFYCTPTAEGRNQNRLILPYYYRDKIVGNTSRFYDDRKPKYIQEAQRGYVFNISAQHKDAEVCILVEGQFDAICIGGAAYMSSTINDEQAALISQLRKKIIVVPDRDVAGMAICERALELGYQVSLPSWNDSVKDVNDAVKRYGKLSTLLSILQSATTNKIKIEMAKRKYT